MVLPCFSTSSTAFFSDSLKFCNRKLLKEFTLKSEKEASKRKERKSGVVKMPPQLLLCSHELRQDDTGYYLKHPEHAEKIPA
eukprot:snap_masked-scaffold_4-processed-gene-4.32-mRNA-1 protein AED:1.00 eAED:1.00 QI:0/0/0/0/1/1/2/0/81